jgi:TonB family protein
MKRSSFRALLALALVTLALPAVALPDTFSALKADAEAGDVEAQATMGRVYAYGWYKDEQIKPDLKQARLWLSKAADAGNGEAAFEMGKTYYPNDGVEGVPWYRKAAVAGITAVYPRLCMAYRAKALYNWDEALTWCRKTAEAGDTAPYLTMARAAERGLEGQPKSPENAGAIYATLADMGEPSAMKPAADYALTRGDGASSLKYTRLAVGFAPEVYIAQLARHYDLGIGVTPDALEAARLYQYALRFESKQTPQTEARDWLTRHPDNIRSQVDARLLRTSDGSDAGLLKHGFARRYVDSYKTIGDFYPDTARRKGIEGVVMIECLVTDTGDLANCMVASETPPEMGFARQTLLIVSRFGMKSAAPQAFTPHAGRLVYIPFAWRLE